MSRRRALVVYYLVCGILGMIIGLLALFIVPTGR